MVLDCKQHANDFGTDHTPEHHILTRLTTNPSLTAASLAETNGLASATIAQMFLSLSQGTISGLPGGSVAGLIIAAAATKLLPRVIAFAVQKKRNEAQARVKPDVMAYLCGDNAHLG